MWFDRLFDGFSGMSEYDKERAKEREFLKAVIASANSIRADQWQKCPLSSDTHTKYEATTGRGAKIAVETYKKHGGILESSYYLHVDGQVIASYNYEIHDDGYSASGGNEQVSTLFHAIKKKVATVEYEKQRPQRELRAAEESRQSAKRWAEDEKKRKDMLRRL